MGNKGFMTMKVRLADYRAMKLWAAFSGLTLVEIVARLVNGERRRQNRQEVVGCDKIEEKKEKEDK